MISHQKNDDDVMFTMTPSHGHHRCPLNSHWLVDEKFRGVSEEKPRNNRFL